MPTLDHDRYLRIQHGAVSSAPAMWEAVEAMEAGPGLKSLLFLGAGGAGILMDPAAELMMQRSTLPTRRMIGAELLTSGWAHLDAGTLVVVPSLSGTTPDALRHIDVVRSAGATVLALVGDADSPVAAASDVVVENPAADDTSSESFYLTSLTLALQLLQRRGEWGEAAEHLRTLKAMPEALIAAKSAFESDAERMAQHIASHDYHIISSSGASYTEAYYYGMCILEEMQWIRTRPVHASDFFHGTLELVEPGVSVVLLKGEDAARSHVERVERFAREHTDAVAVLDTVDADLPGVDSSTRALVSHVVAAALLERVSAHLEVIRDHPLTTRRYYRRVSY